MSNPIERSDTFAILFNGRAFEVDPLELLFSADGKKIIPAGPKNLYEILEGCPLGRESPFWPPTPVTSGDRTPFFLSAFFPGRSRTSYLGRPAIDPIPMIRMLIVS